MKQKTSIKTLLLALMSVALFLFAIRQCKAQAYVSFSFDANKAFNLKDNPRTQTDWQGLDYDIELGFMADERDANIGVYLFYGAFPKAYYRNWGFGFDWYYSPLERLNLSLGNFYQVTKRHSEFNHLGGSHNFINPRGKISYDLNCLTIGLIAKLTNRLDIDKRVFEGQIELKKKF